MMVVPSRLDIHRRCGGTLNRWPPGTDGALSPSLPNFERAALIILVGSWIEFEVLQVGGLHVTA